MKLDVSDEELKRLVARAVAETLQQIEQTSDRIEKRIAYTEIEAASLLGVERHALRDARLRGEVNASRVGKKILYTADELKRLLTRNRLR